MFSGGVEVLQSGGSNINATDIEELIQKVLLALERPFDRVLYAHSSDGGYINIRTGTDGSRPVFQDGRIFDPIQIMYFSVPPKHRRQGLYKNFVSTLESFDQYGMLWIDEVETNYLRSWLDGWGYLRRDNSFYKVIGAPIPASRQEAINDELEQFERAISSDKKFRCWVKPR